VKNKINGGVGEDDDVSAFNDYIYTARIAWGKLLYYKEGIIIISNQKVQDACKKNITQFARPKNKEDIKEIKFATIENRRWGSYFIPKEIELEFYWVNEFDWIQKLSWIKEWRINNTMIDVLLFVNDKNEQIKTGLLTL
jgi:hypothetical protein